MARARTLKAEFFRNEVLGHLPPFARLLFAGLWTLADREGRLEDRPERITAELFPYDRALSVDDIDAFLTLLDDGELIHRYDISGEPYIEIVKWKKHQHPHPREVSSRIPACDCERVCKQSRGSGDAKVMSRTDQGNAEPRPSRAGSTGSTGSSEVNLNPLLTTSVVCIGERAREKKTSRASRLPNDWRLPNEWGQWAMRECAMTREAVERAAAMFADYWHARADAKAAKLDWLATWRNWCRRERGEFGPHAAPMTSEKQHHNRALTGYEAPPNGGVYEASPQEVRNVGPKH